jgi:hypothetical protein
MRRRSFICARCQELQRFVGQLHKVRVSVWGGVADDEVKTADREVGQSLN